MLSQTLKTLTVSLTLVYGVNSVSFAADASPSDKLLDKAQLMQLLRKGGLLEGTQQGVSTKGDACDLTVNTKAGEEKLSMKSSAEEEAQRLLLTEADYIFYSDIKDIPFRTRESDTEISIVQDFDDSSQTVKIEKKSRDAFNVTLTEYIAGDERTLKCIFK